MKDKADQKLKSTADESVKAQPEVSLSTSRIEENVEPFPIEGENLTSGAQDSNLLETDTLINVPETSPDHAIDQTSDESLVNLVGDSSVSVLNETPVERLEVLTSLVTEDSTVSGTPVEVSVDSQVNAEKATILSSDEKIETTMDVPTDDVIYEHSEETLAIHEDACVTTLNKDLKIIESEAAVTEELLTCQPIEVINEMSVKPSVNVIEEKSVDIVQSASSISSDDSSTSVSESAPVKRSDEELSDENVESTEECATKVLGDAIEVSDKIEAECDNVEIDTMIPVEESLLS